MRCDECGAETPDVQRGYPVPNAFAPRWLCADCKEAELKAADAKQRAIEQLTRCHKCGGPHSGYFYAADGSAPLCDACYAREYP